MVIMLLRSLRAFSRTLLSPARSQSGAADRSLQLPFIPMEEFAQRRIRLRHAVRTLPEMEAFSRHVFVLPAAQVKLMAHHVPFTFHQSANFRYLCGFPEPDAALLLTFNLATETDIHSQLFVRTRTAEEAVWNGPVLGVEGARDFGTDDVLELGLFEEALTAALEGPGKIALWFEHDSPVNSYLHDPVARIVSESEAAVFNPNTVLDLMRVVKSPAELRVMREAARIGGEAMAATIRFCGQEASNMSEFKVWAKMDYESRVRGCHLAYPPVVGGGVNANIIHYLANCAPLEPGQLVVMDAGSQVNGYVSDITRAWPVSGRFSEPQRVLYEIVLSVLERCTAQVTEKSSLNRLYHFMLAEIGRQAKSAGLVKLTSRLLNEAEIGHKLCPHHIGHWLGLDVHDTPSVPTTLEFMPGVVFPLEPGIYVPEDCNFVNPEFHGMGIRIEDDIAMTIDGPEVLTIGCPKTTEEIEELMRS